MPTWMELVLQVEDTQREKRMERSGNEYLGAAERYPHLPRYVRQPLLGCFEDIYLTGTSLGTSLLHQMTAPGAAPQHILFQPPPIESLYEPDPR